MSKILSVIIPCYNCESFLDKGLSSLAIPALGDKLEVIVVNDGSLDKSRDICLKYVSKYPEIFKLIDKENGGHGSAINVGAAAAAGKYIKVLDADDWVFEKDFLTFIEKLEVIESHVVLTHHHTVDISTGEIKNWKSYPTDFERSYTLDEIMASFKSFDRSLTFHGITYQREFYIENSIQLSEKVFYEDHEYATIPCCMAETVTPLDIYVYEYRIGDTSQSVSVANQVKRISHVETVLKRLAGERKNLESRLNTGGKREYYLMKVHALLLSYLVTALLGCKDKGKGRMASSDMMDYFKNEYEAVYERTKGHYNILKTLNTLHIGYSGYKRLLNSKLYNKLRGNHEFK